MDFETDSSLDSGFPIDEPLDFKDSMPDSNCDENFRQYLLKETEVNALSQKSQGINKPTVPESNKARAIAGPSTRRSPRTIRPITSLDGSELQTSIGNFSKSPGLKFPVTREYTILDFFEMLFDNKIYEKIISETNKYVIVQKRLSKWVNLSNQELAAFFGMVLGISTKIPVLRLRDIWASDASLRQPYFANIMTYGRFLNLLSYLHFNGNERMPRRKSKDVAKIYKIKPIIDYCNQNFKAAYQMHREVAVGQAISEFTCDNITQECDPSQSIMRSFKWWICADSHNGYVSHMELYTGEDTTIEDELHLDTEALLSVVLPHLANEHHIVFCGKIFSSVKLAKKLSANKLYCCSTLSIYNKGIPHSIINLYRKCKMKRGEWHSVIDENSNLQFLIWMDKKPVLMINNVYPSSGSYAIITRNKFGLRQSYPCPPAVKMYDQYIGGIDLANHKRLLFDWNGKTVRSSMCLFWHCFKTAVSNAHILYSIYMASKHLKAKSFLEFQRDLSRMLINGYSSNKSIVLNTHVSPHLEHQSYVSHTHVDFRSYNIPMLKQCVVCLKKKTRHETHFGCLECGLVPICNTPQRDCFIIYHSKNKTKEVSLENDTSVLCQSSSCTISKKVTFVEDNIPSASSNADDSTHTAMNKCHLCDYKDTNKLVLKHHETNHFTDQDSLLFLIRFS